MDFPQQTYQTVLKKTKLYKAVSFFTMGTGAVINVINIVNGYKFVVILKKTTNLEYI